MLGRCEGITEVEKIGQGSHRMYASYPEGRKEKISICKTRVKWETQEPPWHCDITEATIFDGD